MSIKEANNLLDKHIGDSEAYHSVFDDIIEARLMELDPEFMKAMQQTYADSKMSRWCA